MIVFFSDADSFDTVLSRCPMGFWNRAFSWGSRLDWLSFDLIVDLKSWRWGVTHLWCWLYILCLSAPDGAWLFVLLASARGQNFK
jgi:hypothetical protein